MAQAKTIWKQTLKRSKQLCHRAMNFNIWSMGNKILHLYYSTSILNILRLWNSEGDLAESNKHIQHVMNKQYRIILWLSYNCKGSALHFHFRWIGRKFNTTLSSLDESDKTLIHVQLRVWWISNKLRSQSQSYCIDSE